MGGLAGFEADVVEWINQGIGNSYILDRATYLLVSDYFLPLLMCFWGLGVWFQGKGLEQRSNNQKAVLGAAISLGIANLVVLSLNQAIFRERPIAVLELTNLLYSPTDSSFPANPAAVAFAFSAAFWFRNRCASIPLFLLAGIWSLARVYNGLFYPSDILVGSLIGVGVAAIITLGLKAIEPIPTRVLRGARLMHLA